VGKVLPSVSALYSTFITVLSDRREPLAIGAHTRATWRTALERLIAFRERGNDARFVDLSFEAVQRDPIGQVVQLYDQLGDDLGDEARQRMEAWWAESSKDRTGPGTYSADEFGLDAAMIANEFAFYARRFDVPVAPH